MRGREHKQPQSQTKTHQTTTQNTTKGQRPVPPHLEVFPLYEGETSEKADCELTMGLNSPRKSVGKVSEKAERNGADQRGFAPPTKL